MKRKTAVNNTKTATTRKTTQDKEIFAVKSPVKDKGCQQYGSTSGVQDTSPNCEGKHSVDKERPHMQGSTAQSMDGGDERVESEAKITQRPQETAAIPGEFIFTGERNGEQEDEDVEFPIMMEIAEGLPDHEETVAEVTEEPFDAGVNMPLDAQTGHDANFGGNSEEHANEEQGKVDIDKSDAESLLPNFEKPSDDGSVQGNIGVDALCDQGLQDNNPKNNQQRWMQDSDEDDIFQGPIPVSKEGPHSEERTTSPKGVNEMDCVLRLQQIISGLRVENDSLRKDNERLKNLRQQDAVMLQTTYRNMLETRTHLRNAECSVDKFLEWKREYNASQGLETFGNFEVRMDFVEEIKIRHVSNPTTYFCRLCELVAGREYCLERTLMGRGDLGFDPQCREDLFNHCKTVIPDTSVGTLKNAYGTYKSKNWQYEKNNGTDYIGEMITAVNSASRVKQ